MERTYRLEFNQQKQHFHLDNYSHPENTHGYITVYEACTDFEFKVFEVFINSLTLGNLSNEKVLSLAFQLKRFHTDLLKNNISIIKKS